ncbi:MAG: PVC-type heme-binding CxxCH protein [Ferruginibacter sp.]
MFIRRIGFSVTAFLYLVLLMVSSCNQKEKKAETMHHWGADGPALSPEEALKSFQVAKGFQIELVASEPLISDPVDMEIDEYGRMYVVEMHGYPIDKNDKGRVKMLTDTDGDGKFDKSTIFVDSLILPNSVMRWKKGIIVADAPDIYYFEDTDNDGKADVKKILLTGFSLSNPHVNVNNPMYGIDNWIHLAHRGAISTRKYDSLFGDLGQKIIYPDQPGGPSLEVNADNHSVRFRPEKHLLETTSGRGQFGHTFDIWGHHLYGDNGNHAFAEVLRSPYVNRNKDFIIGDASDKISDHGDDPEVFKITKNPGKQAFSGKATMTSGSGITASLGGLFPAPYDQNTTFIAESVSSLIHADFVKDSGASFVAGRVGEEGKEFLASTDGWSRPVNMYFGPDGALYVVDYYRQIIEHPEWMSKEAVAAGGLYNGSDLGRIYRITPIGTPAPDWIKGINLGKESPAEMVAQLANKNIWWRINAQRLLVDKGDLSIVPQLEQLTRGGVREGRLHALWTLNGLNALTPATIAAALKDSVAGIRENAIQLAEMQMKAHPELVQSLIALQNDPNEKVRFQLLCTLGYLETPQVSQARENILFNDMNDKWVQAAALTATSAATGPLLQTVISKFNPEVPAFASLVSKIAAMVGGSGSATKINGLISQSVHSGTKNAAAWQSAVLVGLADGLKNRSDQLVTGAEQKMLVNAFFIHPESSVREASLALLIVTGVQDKSFLSSSIKKCVALAGDKSAPSERRKEAIKFLVLGKPSDQADLLRSLLVFQEEIPVQLAALNTLDAIPDSTVGLYLLQQWNKLTPGIRDAGIETFMKNENRMNMLLDAIEGGKIPKGSLGYAQITSLKHNNSEPVRNRAWAIFNDKDQEKINKSYEQIFDLTGDPVKGRMVFLQNCGLCHQVRGKDGSAFGPDLGTIQGWQAKDILANILAPDLSISDGFDIWQVKLKTGETLQGIIASETTASIALQPSPGIEKVINRRQIESLKKMEGTIMPVLTNKIDHQQMADLIVFLKQ